MEQGDNMEEEKSQEEKIQELTPEKQEELKQIKQRIEAIKVQLNKVRERALEKEDGGKFSEQKFEVQDEAKNFALKQEQVADPETEKYQEEKELTKDPYLRDWGLEQYKVDLLQRISAELRTSSHEFSHKGKIKEADKCYKVLDSITDIFQELIKEYR